MMTASSPSSNNNASSGTAGAGSAVSSVKETIGMAVMVLLLVYTTVTVVTYNHIASVEQNSTSLVPGADDVPDTSSTTKTGIEEQQQQRAAAVVDVASMTIERLQHTFPIHTADSMEEILHPGLVLSDAPEKIPDGLSWTLKVPKFFEDAFGSVYGGSIRQYLGENGKHLITPQQAAAVGSFDRNGRETIYCSIASYRDPECQVTLIDLYERAKYPDRIRVAIIDQRIEDVDKFARCAEPTQPCDKDPDQILCKYRHLIDVMDMDARLGVGPVFARHLAHRHYRGEYFAMQVDSHVRFVQDWDDTAVGYWKQARNEMAVLTTYLSDLQGSIDPVTHKGIRPNRPIMCASDYEGQGNYKHLRHGQQPEGPAGIHGQPTLHPFWAAGFSFARGHFVIQIPYDQYLPMVFQGEEISIGLRGFTYGYDYYTPEEGLCFHMYAIKENEAKRKAIPLFWENQKSYTHVGMKAMKRLNSLIGMGQFPAAEWPHDDQEKYGLGQVRTTDKFFTTFGIHTKTQTVEHHLCRFVGKPMMAKFLPALRANRMGIDYTKIDYVFKDPLPNQK